MGLEIVISICCLDIPDEIKRSLELLSQNYIFSSLSSKGNNGYLFFGQNKITQVQIALKYYYWGNDDKFHAEPTKLSQINSDNVIKIMSAGFTDGDWAYFITPYCSNGDLDGFISDKLCPVHDALDITNKILTGLSFLHKERFIHRDLKPLNLYLCEDNRVVIGDFGSVKYLPENEKEIPGSGHSLIYRPPESILHNTYNITGDIYQVGLILYQLLGGALPYAETEWLNSSERRIYDRLTDNVDKSIHADNCVKQRITNSQVLKLNSMPSWITDKLKSIIKKACNKDPNKRYQTVSAMKNDLNKAKQNIPNWEKIDDEFHVSIGTLSYKIVQEDGCYKVKKKRTSSWMNDKSFGEDLKSIINTINNKY